MTPWSALRSVVCTAALVSSALGLRIPFKRQSTHTISTTRTAASSSSSYEVVSGFENLANERYVGLVELFGKNFSVIFDTGSNDLWIDTSGVSMTNYANTSVFVELDYGVDGDDSSAKGYVLETPIIFGDFQLNRSTFISVYSASEGLLAPGIDGLLGLGPPTEETQTEANLQAAGSAFDGNSLLEEVFLQHAEVEPQISMLFSRNEGTGEIDGGDFVIGDPLPTYSSISNQPKLPVMDSPLGQHWTIQFDGLIINGKRYTQTGAGGNNFTGILDSGTPTAFIDSYFYDLIYGSYGTGNIPCDTMPNVSFIISGQEYPIHPIDLTSIIGGTAESPACYASMESLPDSPGEFLLGDTFLRNVYTLHNFNHYTKEGDPLPYTQLLSVTNAASAVSQFASLRAQQVQAFFSGSSSSSASASAPAATKSAALGADLAASSTPTASTSSTSSGDWDTLVRNSYIIIGMLGGALLLLLAVAGLSFKNARVTRGYAPVNRVDLMSHDKPYNPQYSD